MIVFKKIQESTRELIFYGLFGFFEFFIVVLFYLKKSNQFVIHPSRLLIICLDNLGDLLFTTPIVNGLRKCYPKAHITVMTDLKASDVYRYNENVDENICIDPNKKRLDVLRDLISIFKNLPKQDLCIVLEKNALFTRFILFSLMLINVRNIIWCHAFLPRYYQLMDHKFLCREDSNKYIVDYYCDLLNKIGIKIVNKGLTLSYSNKDIDQVTSYMVRKKLKSKQFIAFCPFARYYGKFVKTMTQDQMLLFLNRLLSEFPDRAICIIGDRSVQNSANDIIRILNNTIINTCGCFSINELAYFLSQTRLLITVDTGVMHVGVSQKCNIISLFGPTKKEQLIPYEYWKNVVEAISEGSGGVSTYVPIPKKFSNLKNNFDLDEILLKVQHINKEKGENE